MVALETLPKGFFEEVEPVAVKRLTPELLREHGGFAMESANLVYSVRIDRILRLSHRTVFSGEISVKESDAEPIQYDFRANRRPVFESYTSVIGRHPVGILIGEIVEGKIGCFEDIVTPEPVEAITLFEPLAS